MLQKSEDNLHHASWLCTTGVAPAPKNKSRKVTLELLKSTGDIYHTISLRTARVTLVRGMM